MTENECEESSMTITATPDDGGKEDSHVSPRQTSVVWSPSLVRCPPTLLASAQWSCVGTAHVHL